MICPFCGKDDDRVIDSRASDGGVVIRRRRLCNACDRRFTTYERGERMHRLMVVKRDGTRVQFNLDNVIKGVQAACGKRPISEDVKSELVQTVEEQIHRDFDREVPSSEIGRRVAGRLRELDPIAYIRYASEYHGFKTLDAFEEEISELRSRVRNLPNQRDLFAE